MCMHATCSILKHATNAMITRHNISRSTAVQVLFRITGHLSQCCIACPLPPPSSHTVSNLRQSTVIMDQIAQPW
jgi:hypothetical protein